MKSNHLHMLLLISALLLLAGICNYIFLQYFFAGHGSFFRFMNGYFSDSCWAASLYLCIVVFSEKQQWKIADKLLLLLLPFITEMLQYFHILRGTFDFLDIVTYLIILFVFIIIFPTQILNNMKKIKTQFSVPIIFILFFLFAAASTAPMRTTYTKPKPQPCITHKPLTYSPVLVTIYVSGSYNMKDLSEAQRYVPGILINKLNALTPYKYQLADGVKPNLSLYVTYTSDNYGHFGAEIKGYVYDGDFFKTIESNFITFEKLDDEVANKVNSFITGGWCKNCPSPCIP